MKISVVTPTYNRASVIGRAIESVRKQGFSDYEHVIVDDGSVDDTESVVRRYQEEDSHIRYEKMPENRGENAAWNRCVELARGEWLSFLDSDDEYLPGALPRVAEEVASVSSEIGVVEFMTKLEVPGGLKLQGYRPGGEWTSYEPSYLEVMLRDKRKGDMHHCIRRDIFSQNPAFRFPDYINGFPRTLYARLAKHGVGFRYVNVPVDIRHTDVSNRNTTNPKNKRSLAFERAYREFLEEHSEGLRKSPARAVHYMLRIARINIFNKRFARALYWVVRSFVYSPRATLSSALSKK